MLTFSDRPAAIQIEVKSIDDTSNFDEFPDIDLKWRELNCTAAYVHISVHRCLNLKTLNMKPIAVGL